MKIKIFCALLCICMICTFASCGKTSHPEPDDTYVSPELQEVEPLETTTEEGDTTATDYTAKDIPAGTWVVFDDEGTLVAQYDFISPDGDNDRYDASTGNGIPFIYEQTGDGEYTFHMGSSDDDTLVHIDFADSTHMTITYTDSGTVEDLYLSGSNEED